MTQDFFDICNKKLDAIHEKFKFWNGFQFGTIVAMFLTIGDIKRYLVALGCWLGATAVAGVYLHKAKKVLNEIEKALGEDK